MNTKEDILNFLVENKSELFEKYHLSKIGLFGSFSRGDATQESDVDIIFDFKEDVEDAYSMKTALKSYLSEIFNRSIDLAREKYLKSYAKQRILEDVIYV